MSNSCFYHKIKLLQLLHNLFNLTIHAHNTWSVIESLCHMSHSFVQLCCECAAQLIQGRGYSYTCCRVTGRVHFHIRSWLHWHWHWHLKSTFWGGLASISNRSLVCSHKSGHNLDITINIFTYYTPIDIASHKLLHSVCATMEANKACHVAEEKNSQKYVCSYKSSATQWLRGPQR